MIAVVGSVNLDLVAVVDHLPVAGETILAVSHQRNHGGKGANQAVAAARLGSDVAFVGCVGSDPVGEELTAKLVDEGIDVSGVRTLPGASGMAMITIDERGENSIVVGSGANSGVAIDEPASDRVASATTVLTQLEIPMTAVLDTLRVATGTTIVNAAPAVPLPAELLAATDVLIVNEVELAEVAGSSDPVAARRLGVGTVVMTLGERGAQVVTVGDVAYVPAPEVAVRDTTGAGDTFCGAFAAAMDDGHDVFDAAARGVVAGSMATTRIGAREAMPTRSQLDERIAKLR
ncbi:MAG: ribokinase [Acidimicrobiia bacterium]